MATDLVTNALANLYSLYQEERELMQFTDQEKEKLASHLSAIKSVLRDAEEKQLKGTSRGLDDWLQKLEDALFLLDDILDDCSTETIRDMYEGDRSCSFLSFLHPHKFKFRHDISRRMKAIMEQLDLIDQEKNRFGIVPFVADAAAERQASANLHPNILRGRQTSSAMTEDCVYGREVDKENLVRQLLDDGSHAENLMVHTIVGMGGLGKTTLAQLVYHDRDVQNHFQLKIWICVSENFELETLVKSVLGTPQSVDHLETLQRKLRDTLQGKRYLLVLDDIWNDDPEKWNQFRCLLSCGSKGSSVLVTTRQEKIATIMKTPTLQPYHLTGLSDEACWQVFRRRAFGLSVAEETENLITIGKEIVRKCKGVPLAAKALGGLLSFTSDEKAWVRIKKSELWNLSNAEDSIFGALRLSYLNLPTKFKRCFTFCAVFPKDYKIEKDRITHLWMANDLIPSEAMIGTTSEIEDVCDEIISELHWRSLIEDIDKDEYGDIASFKMHDLVHDLAQSIMGDVIYAVDGTSPPQELKQRTRHVWFGNVKPGMTNGLLKNVKGLRTYITGFFFHEFPMILSEHTSLRALDLSEAHFIESPSSFCVLKHLRYLNLSYTSIVELPESICSFWNLQILNLDCCSWLKTLPQGMGRLRSLRHLYMRNCLGLLSMPMSLGSLTSLRSLSFVVVGESESRKLGFQISGLGLLKNLKGKMKIVNLERVSEVRHALEAKLMEKSDLDKLTFRWYRSNDQFSNMKNNGDSQHEMQVLEALQPSPNLKYLNVSNYRGPSFPQWMMNGIVSFTYIRFLHLKRCINCTQLPPLWRLPHLKTLRLCSLASLRYLIEGERGSHGQIIYDICFRSLETLTLDGLDSFEGMLMGNDDEEEVEAEMNKKKNILLFPHLSSLTIKKCHRLNSFADWGSLQSLRYLKIHDSALLPLSNRSNVQTLNYLQELAIEDFNSLESLPDQLFQGLSSLKKLSIKYCINLKSLPTGFKYIPSLEELHISLCTQLIDISIIVHHLPCLQTLSIWNSPFSSFDNSTAIRSSLLAEDISHFPALEDLSLHDCENLESLPNWFGDILHLERLRIYSCPKLKCIPDCFQRLTNLNHLEIYDCPVLSMRCKKETGEDWNNIAHISYIVGI